MSTLIQHQSPYAYGLLLRWYVSEGTSVSTYTCRLRGLFLPTSQGRDIHKSSFMEYFQNFFKSFWKSSLDDLPFSKVNHILFSLQVSCSLALRRLQVQSSSQLHSFTSRNISCMISCSNSRLYVILHDWYIDTLKSYFSSASKTQSFALTFITSLVITISSSLASIIISNFRICFSFV